MKPKDKDYTALLKPVGTKQTAVEWLEKELNELLVLFSDKWEKVNKVIEQAKEMEKENTCYFGARCCLMTTQKNEWTLEELYDEIFKNK